MFGFGTGEGVQYYPALYLNAEIIFFMILGIAGSFPLFPRLKGWYEKIEDRAGGRDGKAAARLLNSGFALVYTLYLTAVLLFSIMVMTSGTYNPFIYFRF